MPAPSTLYDAYGNPVGGPQNPLQAQAQITPGGSVSRILGRVFNRAEVGRFRAFSPVAASGLTSQTLSNSIDLSAFRECLVYISGVTTLSGSPVTVKLFFQITDGGSIFVDHPDAIGGIAVTPNSNTTGPIWVSKFTNFGDDVRVGIQAGTAWSGGTITIYVKAKS